MPIEPIYSSLVATFCNNPCDLNRRVYMQAQYRGAFESVPPCGFVNPADKQYYLTQEREFNFSWMPDPGAACVIGPCIPSGFGSRKNTGGSGVFIPQSFINRVINTATQAGDYRCTGGPPPQEFNEVEYERMMEDVFMPGDVTCSGPVAESRLNSCYVQVIDPDTITESATYSNPSARITLPELEGRVDSKIAQVPAVDWPIGYNSYQYVITGRYGESGHPEGFTKSDFHNPMFIVENFFGSVNIEWEIRESINAGPYTVIDSGVTAVIEEGSAPDIDRSYPPMSDDFSIKRWLVITDFY